MPPKTESACAILAFGRFLPPADAELMLGALARLFDLDWTLTIVNDGEWQGDGPRALAQSLEISQRLRVVDRPDWDGADAFACAVEPPELDDLAADAFRHGVPIVAISTSPGARITPETGMACPPGDLPHLSKALRRLIFDTGLRHDMTEAARKAGAGMDAKV